MDHEAHGVAQQIPLMHPLETHPRISWRIFGLERSNPNPWQESTEIHPNPNRRRDFLTPPAPPERIQKDLPWVPVGGAPVRFYRKSAAEWSEEVGGSWRSDERN